MFALCASQIVDFLVRFADFARTCAVIVNVPDLKAYSSVAAKLLRRVTSYASSEALLVESGLGLLYEYLRSAPGAGENDEASMPLHRTHPVHDVGLLRCCLRCLSASKGRHAGARWNPTETLCGNSSPSGYQSIASGALVLTSVCLSHDMWVMTQLSARIRTTHPALPRSMHASRSHYEIRPIGPPLVGGGGGACSSRTSV
eukprot:COSAG01_NODE_192_length_22494_cov_100.193384_6_plen_201_part_00